MQQQSPPANRKETLTIATLALTFFATITWFTFRQYAVFHLQAPDVVMFSQSMWYTLRGQLLYNTLDNHSALAFHFTPIFALMAPALWIWEDPRILFLIQTAGITASGLIIWRIAHHAAPKWAIPLTAVYYLNPSLHEVAINELRRITIATPFIALALYGLYTRKTKQLLIGLFFALLCKEDVAILVFTFGLFVLLIWRNWQLGTFLTSFGLISFFALTFCVIPSLHPDQATFGCYPEAYPQLKYFSTIGADEAPSTELDPASPTADSDNPVLSIITNLLLSPGQVISKILDVDGRAAIFRTLIPFALLLPLIGWEWFLLTVPTVALMMLSANPQLHTLRDWYLAPILPIVTVATIIGLQRIPAKWQKAVVPLLILCTLGSYAAYSHLPGGRLYLPVRYQITEHHQIAHTLLERVPDSAAVMAQDAFTQHLAMRPQLHHLRWNSWAEIPFDYLVVDRNLKHYPFDLATINSIIDNRVADPTLTIAAEGDGMYLFQANAAPHPAQQVNAVAEESILLEKIELSVTNEQGIYLPQTAVTSATAAPQQTIRVTLYWQALAQPRGNRTVSIRLNDPSGWLIAQHDSVPSNGGRPTAVWETGWAFRDVYYLTIPEGTAPTDNATLSILLYDSATQERVPFATNDQLDLAQVTIR